MPWPERGSFLVLTTKGWTWAVPQDLLLTLGYCLPPHSTSRLPPHIKHLPRENLCGAPQRLDKVTMEGKLMDNWAFSSILKKIYFISKFCVYVYL